jgi:hypothetical protein
LFLCFRVTVLGSKTGLRIFRPHLYTTLSKLVFDFRINSHE